MKGIKVMFRYGSEGCRAFTPAPGSVGMDRSVFGGAVTSQDGDLDSAGDMSFGRTLSVWVDVDAEGARDAVVSEAIAKITVARAMLARLVRRQARPGLTTSGPARPRKGWARALVAAAGDPRACGDSRLALAQQRAAVSWSSGETLVELG
jgi:hypothetical protein